MTAPAMPSYQRARGRLLAAARTEADALSVVHRLSAEVAQAYSAMCSAPRRRDRKAARIEWARLVAEQRDALAALATATNAHLRALAAVEEVDGDTDDAPGAEAPTP